MTQTLKKAMLVLQNGRTLQGYSFGYDGPVEGEVVFFEKLDTEEGKYRTNSKKRTWAGKTL